MYKDCGLTLIRKRSDWPPKRTGARSVATVLLAVIVLYQETGLSASSIHDLRDYFCASHSSYGTCKADREASGKVRVSG
jgi:hypothetical protein